MAIADKIIVALQDPLDAEFISLDVDDGISGFVVSSKFENMSSSDRQQLIDTALRNAKHALSSNERREILMIAGLTPLEYESAGARIRVHKIKQLADGSLEVLLHGTQSDAVYVGQVLGKHQGVTTSEPEQVPGAVGILMKLVAKGTQAKPLTKVKAIKALKADQYIELMKNA